MCLWIFDHIFRANSEGWQSNTKPSLWKPPSYALTSTPINQTLIAIQLSIRRRFVYVIGITPKNTLTLGRWYRYSVDGYRIRRPLNALERYRRRSVIRWKNWASSVRDTLQNTDYQSMPIGSRERGLPRVDGDDGDCTRWNTVELL